MLQSCSCAVQIVLLSIKCSQEHAIKNKQIRTLRFPDQFAWPGLSLMTLVECLIILLSTQCRIDETNGQ